MTAWPERLIGLAGGLSGLLGVGLSALAVHSGAGPGLETSARFLLVHAPALLGLTAMLAGRHVGARTGRFAGLGLVLGLALFCGDLAIRALAGIPLWPMAAPTGGVLLMLGWALIGAACLVPRRIL